MSGTPTIRQIADKYDLAGIMDQLAQCLSDAFYNDPYYVYIMPNSLKRRSQLIWWFKIVLTHGVRNGMIYITSDLKGASIWFGPDKPNLDNLQLALSGLILFPFKVGFNNFLRMLDVSTKWEKVHLKQPKRNYYLMIIGVDRVYRRKGYGSLLMQNVLKKADQEGVVCYLETVNPEDLLFYKQHDFAPIIDKSFGGTNRYWILTRQPRAILP
jgi:ribosomal protein S18 acetylase RimI-like enzyme